MDVNVNLFNVSFRGTLRVTGEESVVNRFVTTPYEKAKVMADAVDYSLSNDSPFRKVDSVSVYKRSS